MTTKEQIEVMQAFEDGKEIESKWHDEDDGWSKVTSPVWNWSKCDYRVKEEPKYRPYKDTEEMINDFNDRVIESLNIGKMCFSKLQPPSIWVKDEDGGKQLITGLGNYNVVIDGYWNKVEDLLKTYTYLDGSPVGVRVNN